MVTPAIPRRGTPAISTIKVGGRVITVVVLPKRGPP
jgi:hypothetical protein